MPNMLQSAVQTPLDELRIGHRSVSLSKKKIYPILLYWEDLQATLDLVCIGNLRERNVY